MNSSMPEIIYRYQPFNALSLDALCHDRLYFSDPNKFNDPLDCKPVVINDSDKLTLRNILIALIETRVTGEVINSLRAAKVEGEQAQAHAHRQGKQEAGNKIRNIAYHATNPDYEVSVEEAECNLLTYAIQTELLKQNNRGVCCLSEEYNNPLLWSHYGDQHKGFCLGYSLDRNPKPEINKVAYGGERTVQTSLIAGAVLQDDEQAQELLDNQMFLRKAEPWQYEKEWRIFHGVGLQDSPLKLEEINFGIRCPDAVIHAVVEALEPRDIKFYSMHSVWKTFELDRTDDLSELRAFLPRTSRSGIEMFGDLKDIY
ncbi:MAG: DUF2971 domain-containing protein [Candidatus Thiodiazotropha endolucinida]